jgi:hypothetical protein
MQDQEYTLVWSPRVYQDTVRDALFVKSRERKARFMDGLAVGLLMVTMAGLGVVVFFAAVPR